MFPSVSAAPAAGAQPQNAIGRLDTDTFLKLLVAQMRFQNPLSPTDPSSMLQQTAAFTQVERLQQVADVQEQLLRTQLAASAGDMVGRHVTAEQPDGSTVSGVVDAVRYTADGPVLQVGDDELSLTSITRVSTAAPSQPTSPASA